jgi:hypothetical protein
VAPVLGIAQQAFERAVLVGLVEAGVKDDLHDVYRPFGFSLLEGDYNLFRSKGNRD